MKMIIDRDIIVSTYLALLGMTIYQFAFTVASYFTRDMLNAGGLQIIAPLPFYLLIFFLAGFLFTNKVLQNNGLNITKNMVILALLIMFPIDLFNHILYQSNNYDSSNKMLVYCASFAYLCCVLVLYGIRIMNHQTELSNENAIVNDMLKKSDIQYRISSSNIDYLNKLTHDLMHKLSGLYALDKKEERASYLDEISSSLTLYDSFFDTKNKALDTILSEKKIFCNHTGITFKCFANGADFDFIALSDIYTLLNGPLDNVISHVVKIPDADHKYIHLRSTRTGNMLSIAIEHYYDGFSDVKSYISEYHENFKSVEYTIRKYNGSMNVKENNGLISINMLLIDS